MGFHKDLENLINRYSKENGSNTPDFILAEYLDGCLRNFDLTIKARERWYGRELRRSAGPVEITDPPPNQAGS